MVVYQVVSSLQAVKSLQSFVSLSFSLALDPRMVFSHTSSWVPCGTVGWTFYRLLPKKSSELFKGIIMTFIKNIGFIFLAVYLILVALTTLAPGIAIPSIVVAIVALVAAIFILIGK